MLPTMEIGQRVLVTDLDDAARGELVPGEVVLFHYPPGTRGLAIKRVVAVGGDTVAFDEHSITVSGLSQSIAGTPMTGADAHEPTETVPADAVFLLGDSRRPRDRRAPALRRGRESAPTAGHPRGVTPGPRSARRGDRG